MKPEASPRAGTRALSRRELLRGATLAGALASVPPLLGAAPALARAQTDADVLHRLLGVEHLIAFAYRHVLDIGVLSAAAAMVSLFSTHEQQHAAVLDLGLRRLGGRPPPPPAGTAAADKALDALGVTKRLSDLRTQPDAIELLIGLEAAITGGYYTAISKLADPALVRSAAQIMGAEAQHSTALRRLLHPRAVDKFVPSAFVEGRH